MSSNSEPLPPLAHLFEGDEAARLAYQRLLPLEDREPLFIRVLGQMLLQAPSAEGRAYVARSINVCSADQEIIESGRFHLAHFVNYFKTKSKASRTPSTHISRPSFDAIRQSIADSLVPPPTNHSDAKRQALVRDNYRCMLSGVVDSGSAKSLPHLAAELAANGSARRTQCSHILPQFINRGVEEETKRGYASKVWTVARLFGGIPDHELNGAGIHGLGNIMTLEVGVHEAYDALEIWLEPTNGTENQYFVRRQQDWILRELPQVVTFVSTSPQLPLPDPRHLALHAACARVIKLAGAAEFIERVLDEADQVKVLSEDGSTAELLGHLLSGESLAVF